MSSEAISSDEENADHHQNDTSGGTKRCYDCTFCKRGFTNAQALGGHMNIHRKDRAKAKQETTPDHSKFSTNYEHSSMTLNPFASEFHPNQPLTSHYPILETQRNIDMHFHQPSNQLAPLHHEYQYEIPNQISLHQPQVHFNQEIWGADLSLQTGSHHHVDHQNAHHQANKRGNQIDSDDEVDLELRLGHDSSFNN